MLRLLSLFENLPFTCLPYKNTALSPLLILHISHGKGFVIIVSAGMPLAQRNQ